MKDDNKGYPDYKPLEERMQEQNDEYIKYLMEKAKKAKENKE